MILLVVILLLLGVDILNAYATSIVNRRIAQETGYNDRQIAKLQDQIERLQNQIDELTQGQDQSYSQPNPDRIYNQSNVGEWD